MSIFTDPTRVTKYAYRQGDRGIGVWALQRFLNEVGTHARITEDGVFGPGTQSAVESYQRAVGAHVDGVVGPETQSRIVRSLVVRAPGGDKLPKGLIEGQIDAESGRLLGAVNWSVPGGFDAGLTQRRVYGPPFIEAAVKAAFDPQANVNRAVSDLTSRYLIYRSRVATSEYAWRLAALAHNWPWAAEELSRGRKLSTTKRATWAPASVRFADGAPVWSYADWAAYYAMGSHAHRHPGVVTKLAFGVPA